MKPNTIIFADLSTYTPNQTKAFYSKIFGWEFFHELGYYTAYKNNQEVVGMYETPEKFKQMQMPHFWMTYIQVNDVTQTVAKALDLGGIIEMNQEIEGFGKMALIRDPQGAGFTVYEGDNLKNTRTQSIKGTLIWNELHISDIQNILPFYEGIFDWQFQKITRDSYAIFNKNEDYIADALEIPNFYKGKYEYWVCTFGVDNLKETENKILSNDGIIVVNEGNRILCTDNSGEAFFYVKEVR